MVVRFAVVGCGAATELLHLPALRAIGDVRVTTCVDVHRERATQCAELLGTSALLDWRDASEEVDALLVSTSPHSHFAICREAIAQGKHVLCEKPFVLSSDEADELAEGAGRAGVVLGVCHARRLAWSSQVVKMLLESSALGRITSIRMEEGAPYGWPQRSGDIFDPTAGTGVLLANGVHCLDLLYWWCDGQLSVDEHLTDGETGPEANSVTRLTGRIDGHEFPAHLEFSTTRHLNNSVIIRGSRYSLHLPSLYDFGRLMMDHGMSDMDIGQFDRLLPCEVRGSKATNFSDLHQKQLLSFTQACMGRGHYYHPVSHATNVIALAEQCRRIRTTIAMPWDSIDEALLAFARAL